jgi:MoxR-like ATPase
MDNIFIGLGANGERQTLKLSRANRHGLIAGATGTGKTVTLQTLAEQFSAAGVPVFMADVKGDLAGISMAGSHDFKHADKIGGAGQGTGDRPVRIPRQSGGVLGSLRRKWPPDPHHHFRNGTAAAQRV